MNKMINSYAEREAAQEGRSAKIAGLEIFENPYSYTHEKLQAHAWREGFKTAPTKENQMREFLEDLIGCLCLFAMIPGIFFLLYGFGWQ
jgi:hypothetical protein